MKEKNLSNFSNEKMNHEEMSETNGGTVVNPWTAGMIAFAIGAAGQVGTYLWDNRDCILNQLGLGGSPPLWPNSGGAVITVVGGGSGGPIIVHKFSALSKN